MNAQQIQNPQVKALGPGDADDGDAGRQQRGLVIAALAQIEKNRVGYKVPSQSGSGAYVVNLDGEPFCSCPDFEKRHQRCKHIYAVGFIIQREERPDGTIVETKAMRMTYRQDWPAYNAAQTHEQERFVSLLRELCDTIPQPPQTFGRPPMIGVPLVSIPVLALMALVDAVHPFKPSPLRTMLAVSIPQHPRPPFKGRQGR